MAISMIYSNQTKSDVQNLCHDKASVDMALNEFILLTSSCWDEKYQSPTIEVTKNKNTGRYRLGPNFLFQTQVLFILVESVKHNLGTLPNKWAFILMWLNKISIIQLN